MIWICCYIVRNKMLPFLFPRTHPAMTEARKKKTIGHVMKGLLRFLVLLQLISIGFLWTTDGLKLGFTTKTRTVTTILPNTNGTCRANKTITTYDLCDGIHGTARRTWKASGKHLFITPLLPLPASAPYPQNSDHSDGVYGDHGLGTELHPLVELEHLDSPPHPDCGG